MDHTVIKTNSAGRDLWNIPVNGYLDFSAFLSPDRKLYLLGSIGEFRDALIFGESPK